MKQAENVPLSGKSPRVREWLRSLTPSSSDHLRTIEHIVLMPGPGSPPALLSNVAVPLPVRRHHVQHLPTSRLRGRQEPIPSSCGLPRRDQMNVDIP